MRFPRGLQEKTPVRREDFSGLPEPSGFVDYLQDSLLIFTPPCGILTVRRGAAGFPRAGTPAVCVMGLFGTHIIYKGRFSPAVNCRPPAFRGGRWKQRSPGAATHLHFVQVINGSTRHLRGIAFYQGSPDRRWPIRRFFVHFSSPQGAYAPLSAPLYCILSSRARRANTPQGAEAWKHAQAS